MDALFPHIHIQGYFSDQHIIQIPLDLFLIKVYDEVYDILIVVYNGFLQKNSHSHSIHFASDCVEINGLLAILYTFTIYTVARNHPNQQIELLLFYLLVLRHILKRDEHSWSSTRRFFDALIRYEVEHMTLIRRR